MAQLLGQLTKTSNKVIYFISVDLDLQYIVAF